LDSPPFISWQRLRPDIILQAQGFRFAVWEGFRYRSWPDLHATKEIGPCFSNKAEIQSHKDRILTRPTVLSSTGLLWYTDETRIAGKSGEDVCGVRPEKRLFFSLSVHASTPAINFCYLSLWKRMYKKSLYMWWYAQTVKQLCGLSWHEDDTEACLGRLTGTVGPI
jgi:hypothetical protein